MKSLVQHCRLTSLAGERLEAAGRRALSARAQKCVKDVEVDSVNLSEVGQ